MDDFDFDKTGVQGDVTYSTFGCDVFQRNPSTPDKLAPDVRFERGVQTSNRLVAPDGREIRYWGFTDPLSSKAEERAGTYPSPLMRMRAGQVVHSTIFPSKNAHTLHHHGIEPTTFNDGVGHVSFEPTDQYTYQFQPKSEGTFFYHCHRNTPLHFEMGMFGPIIIDPPQGPGYVTNGTALERYDVEKLWVVDDMDPRWHELSDHDAGLCGDDVGLNRFDPKYFLVSGVFNNKTMTDPRIVAQAKVGDTILLRINNASYSVLRITIGIESEWVNCDGHRFGKDIWCNRVPYAANAPFMMTTAMRQDLLIRANRAGTFNCKFEFLHWITGRVQDNGKGIANTRIIVS